jgi:phage-related holin
MENINVTGWLLKIGGMVLVITLPIRPALIAISLLVFADMLTGIWASLKEGKSVTSSGLRRTVTKTLTYQAAIIFAFIMQTYLLEGMPIVNVVTGLIGVTEGKSFFENIKRINGIDFWAMIVSKVNLPDIKNLDDQGK